MAFTTSRGYTLTQLSDVYKLPLYTSFEYYYEPQPGLDFAKQYWQIPLVLVTVYMASLYFGTRYMKTRQRFDLRNNLAMWNLFLCVFSLCGAFRTVPHLLHNVSTMSLTETMTRPSAADWGSGACGLWVQLFIFSKIPELWDTFYIVARKRPLLFLHWYHHVTVLLYCWHSYATEAPQALYFVAMNYSVHGIMYGYYCLMALKMKPKWIPPVLITIAQLSQMVVGTAVQLFSMYLYFKDGASTNLDLSNLCAGAVMYGSYFALFFQFFWNRFVVKARADAKNAKLA